MDSQSPMVFNGDSPLHVAVRQGRLEDVRTILFQQQVDVNILNSKHETPLHLACSQRDSAIIQLLIAFGADPYSKDSDDESAFGRSSYDIIILMNKLLFSNGFWINSPTQSDGDTLLHTAVRLGRLDDVQRITNKQTIDVNDVNVAHETPLHLACEHDHKQILHILISNGGCLYRRDCYNNAAIHRAVSRGHIDIMNYLITDHDCACDPKVKGYQGRTLLHYACGVGNVDLVNILIEKHGISPMAADAINQTPLHIAASHGQEEIVCLLITKYNCLIDCRNHYKLSPLHLASYCGHVSVANLLVPKYKADVNAIDEAGDTPLHKASFSGHLSVVRVLVSEFKADTSLQNDENDTAVSKAAEGGHVETVQALITELGCSPKVTGYDGRSLLHEACCSGNIKLTEMLITEFSLNISSVDDSGDTPLHMACMYGHEELARLLITKYNCPVDIKNKNKETPLHKACSLGNADVVRMLVSEFKADNDTQNYQNDTPLNKAALGGHADIVQMLITEFGCSPQIKGFEGRSLLHQACNTGHTKLAMILIADFKLNPLSADDSGNTPLHMACMCGHEELARLLITKYNCPVEIKCKTRETPLHIACASGHLKIVRMLVSEFKADTSLRNHQNDTAVSKAAKGGYADAVQILITELGCSPKVTGYNGRSLLHEACCSGIINLTDMLITDFSLDISSVDDSGNTPLHLVCWRGHVELARLLITKYNCPVEIKNKTRETPLHKACASGHLTIVRMLTSEFNADISLRNHQNDTAVSKAAEGGHVDTVQILITELGCSPKVTGYNGRSLLHEACCSGSIKLTDMLITSFNLNVLSTDDSGDTPLHMACMYGHEELARLLITKYNCPVDIKNKNKETPLHKACSLGKADVVRMLVSEFKADNDTRNYQNDTPLNKAVLGGHADIVQMLITEFGCSPQIKGFEGRSLLHQACDKGHTKLAMILIADFKLDPFSADDSGNTPLHMACWHGHEELARLLITKYNCPVEIKCKTRETPLHKACASGHLKIVRMLVSEFKVDTSLRNHQNDTAVSKAAKGGHVDTVQILITELGCSPKVTGYNSRLLLHEACRSGSIKLTDMLITNFNLNVLSTDDSGDTPLHLVCWYGHEELARLLITKYNCPVGIKNKNKETPLHKACSLGKADVVRMLVSEFKADNDTRNCQNDTPLNKAALGGHADIVQMLITEFGCSPQIKGFEGRSLLHQACDKGHTKLAMILIADFKLDPLSADNSGNIPLHTACMCGHKELARLLITKYNCPVGVKNNYKQTPLHIACSCGHLGVSKMLISKYSLGSSSNKRFTIDCNTLDKNGNTPLDLVIKKGDAKAVHILSTKYGCKPHVKRTESKQLLHQLAARGFNKMLRELLSNFNHDPASVDEDGNTLLHTAVQHGNFRMTKFLITNHRDHCSIDCRNSRGQTALHCACIGGHTAVAKLLVANKANMTIRDEDGDTPLKKAFLTDHGDTLFQLFNSNLRIINSRLLHHVCEHGSTDLVDILLSDFDLDASSILDNQGNRALHIAVTHCHNEIIALLINKYECPVDSRNFKEQTPLHLLCSQTPTESVIVLIKQFITEFKADLTSKDKYGQTPLHLLCCQTPTDTVDALIKMFITELNADVSSRNRRGDQPIHVAAQAGCTSTVINLILDYGCSSDSRGFKNRTLLHHALAAGHTSTAKTLIDVFLNNLSLHCIDNDGNTPLHLSSLYEQPESVRLLLYDYHAPIHVRNKAGKTALDLAKNDSTKKVIGEYVRSKHISIQQEYEELRTKSLQKYSGQQIITRVFVLGNPGSGKSTLIEALKRKGIIYSFFTITEADVPLHTAGIVPSVHQSKETGQLLYYDFAGDKEYFSSHAAILEIVSHLNVGSNIYFIVADSRKDDMTIHNEIGYWLSFISYHGKALVSQYGLKIIVILSHSDHLSLTDSAGKVESMKQYLHSHMNQYGEIFDIVEVVSSNCRSPRSSRSIETILQQISKDTPPCSISYETSLLHGMLEKDFSNVVACKFQDLLSNIKDSGICLPTVPDALYPIVKELHDIGLLMMIGRSEDRLEDYLLLLNLSSLTHEVHQLLFSSSESVIQNFNSSTSSRHYADMGILPESYLASVLPEHITKECLVQLQYCQEFHCAEVGLTSSSSTLENNLLYFPALCRLDSERSNWPSDPQLNFSIGWYTKCTGELDYFPTRFLHVLLLRLAFAFALPIANCNITESNEISAHNRRCTMWKNGIRWLMEEGVECIFEMVNDNKGIVVITKSKAYSKEWATILTKIIDKVMQAKAEFCNTVSLHHFLLKPDKTSSFKNSNNLFEVTEVEKVIREGKKMVVSVSGRTFLDSSHLFIFRKYTFWGVYFPMNMPKVLSFLKDVVEEWERLGVALQIPYEILREINTDISLVATKKEEMIMKWMDLPGPACWWLLIKALKEIDQNVAAAAIKAEQGEAIEIQRKLIEGGDQKPDDAFLQSFATVVGDHWPSLASLLSITARETEEIKKEEKEQQALCMLTKWSAKKAATFKQLHQKFQTVYLFRC